MPPDFTVRSDSVNVEQIMEQIRARIREKRGVDYTEQQIRELAAVKLEKFLDPRGVRSDLLEQFRKAQPAYAPPELPNYAFEDRTLYESTRPPLKWIRKLLNPVLKLFFNPNPLIQALNIQARLNTMYAEREARRDATRRAFDQLQYELMHNLVIETTRMSIEVKNLKMRVESLASRLEFNERRARALESVVVYKPSAGEAIEAPRSVERAPSPPPRSVERAPSPPPRYEPGPAAAREGAGEPQRSEGLQAGPSEGPGQRSRRRRRRGRRGRRPAASMMGQAAPMPSPATDSVPDAALSRPTDRGPTSSTGEPSTLRSPHEPTGTPSPVEGREPQGRPGPDRGDAGSGPSDLQ